MATIEYNVPVHHHRARKVTYETRKGRVAWFNVGAERVKFVLQLSPLGDATHLVHYASGYVFGRLDDARIRHMCSVGTYAPRLTDRQAAEHLIAAACARADVLAKLASVPVLNH